MATLGLIATNNFATNSAPENWREGILRLFPNGSGSLTAFLALLESEKTSDFRYHWWDKAMPLQTAFINNGGGYAVGITTFTIDDSTGPGNDPGKQFRKGHVLLNMRTNEQMLVTSDQSAGTSVTVQRGFGEVAAATINDNDELRVIGNVNEQGGPLPTSVFYDPTERYNYCEIVRTPLSMTRTAMMTHLRTEPQKKQAKIEALMLQSIEMEKSLLWGQRYLTTGTLGKPMAKTRGLVRWITADAPANDNTASGGTLNETELLGYLEPIFRYGSTEKLLLAGSTFLNVLTQIAKSGSQLNLEPGTEVVYGIRLRRFITAFGDLLVKMHPLFNEYSDWRQTGLILDVPNLRYRYVQDLGFFTNRQNPGDDARTDEFLAECGLEVHHAKTHGVIRGVSSFG